MRRREFITLLGGAAGWPLAAHAEPRERVRRIGVLEPLTPDDPMEQGRMAAFVGGLKDLGRSEGANLRIDFRWNVKGPAKLHGYVQELVALRPDAIMVTSSAPMCSRARCRRIGLEPTAPPV